MLDLHKSRRSRGLWFPISLLLTLTLILSACGNAAPAAKGTGGNTANTPETSEAPTVAESSTPETPATKTVKTMNGDIEIPVLPKRIVAEEYIGSLIPLGTIPVGAPGLTLQNMYFQEALKDVTDTGTYGKMNAEKIFALDPDLIITGNNDSYPTLSKIAPTIVVPYGELKNAHEELTYFGQLLGKEKEAADWLAEYDERIAAAKAKVDKAIPAEATFSIMENADKTTYVYGDNFGRGGQPIYQALGRKPPAEVADEIMEKQWAELSEEVISKYAGDYIILTSNTRTVESFKTDPLWGSLPAVKNNHLYVWKEERSWYYDPMAVLSQTEELADWLTKGK
ncbi:ABC transporter substrate-binding protein [Bacillus sp. FJAT-27264]|uniref:ABC transporter substrate-binding protein n=1 Tax=Paenibacillus sp. (strain DSM 101736 / FJAT-27264) TaxID=1850362 RepID=UPI000808143A|nr:ABC transporter substrate-binding protein [Bacillus sp. FJAT-27264]OBZ18857.1 ABC transporter substrate-binding protein [Bacillus sp. FJAT-27264]